MEQKEQQQQQQPQQEEQKKIEQQKEEVPAAQAEVTEELLNDLKELIQDPKLDVRKGVLNILMSRCLQTEEQRAKFEPYPIFIKQIMNYASVEGLQIPALTCLIQLSSDTIFHEQLHDCNAGDRIVNIVKDTIENIVAKEFKLTKQDMLIIELSILILVNFTQSVLGKNSFLSLERDNEQQGLNIMLLTKVFSNPKTAFLMKYFPNILVNISSYDTGRKLLVQPENDFIASCFQYILCKERNTRTGIQKTVRNVVHEYENEEFVKALLAKDVDFINQICVGLLIVINSSVTLSYKGMEEGEKSEKINYVVRESLKSFGVDPNTIFINSKGVENDIHEIWTLVDSLLILTNYTEIKEAPYDQKFVQETIAILKNLKVEQMLSDKIEVLEQVY